MRRGLLGARAIALAERHHLVIPDLPGLAESEPIARLDVAAFADWFAALIQQTCQEPPVLVAHSLDGSLAAHFAAGHGDLPRRLVIYAAPGIGRYRMPLKLRVAALRFELRPGERNFERFERLAFFDLDSARRRDRQWIDAFAAYTRSRATVPHVKRAMRRLIDVATRQVSDPELRAHRDPDDAAVGPARRFRSGRPRRGREQQAGLAAPRDRRRRPRAHIEQPDAFLAALSSELDDVRRTDQA